MLKIMAARATVFGNITVEREREREKETEGLKVLNSSAAGRRLGKIGVNRYTSVITAIIYIDRPICMQMVR